MATATMREEHVLVLYGSQTGNSEQAAKDLCNEVSTKLSPEMIQNLTGTKDLIHIQPMHMQLDDFLEIERATWTRLIVIVVSSYGVGSAPLGAYRFRDLCDAWADAGSKNVLNGVHFAMCGLGDSKYTTFFENPTKIDKTLQQVGATRVGPLGKADASGTGQDVQLEVIDRWTKGVWPHLANVVVKDPLPKEQLQQMQDVTVALCRKINPDFLPEARSNAMVYVSIVFAVVAILAYIYQNKILS